MLLGFHGGRLPLDAESLDDNDSRASNFRSMMCSLIQPPITFRVRLSVRVVHSKVLSMRTAIPSLSPTTPREAGGRLSARPGPWVG
jgi:hypothetical protein